MIRAISKAIAASLFTLAALPALGEDANLCGGLGVNGQWLGGDEASSDITTSPAYIERMALVLMQNEFVGLFSVSQDGNYRIEAEGRGGGDTVLDVRNASGDIVASDDDSGGGASSRAENFLPIGTYCVSMRSFDSSPITGFVRAGRLDQEPLTPGIVPPTNEAAECDLSVAQALTFGQPVTNAWAEQNFYSFQIDAPAAVTITAENQDADPTLKLFDASGSLLGNNDDFDGLNSRIDMADMLPAGQYCVALDVYGDGSLPITMTAKIYDAMEVQMNLYARGDASPPLDGSYPVKLLGELQTRLRQDVNVSGDAAWYTFDIYDSGLVLIEAIAQGEGDPMLFMYDDLGRQIGHNDDNDGSLNSILTVRVQPGTYLVAVRQLDDQTQGPIRMVFERYVPARP